VHNVVTSGATSESTQGTIPRQRPWHDEVMTFDNLLGGPPPTLLPPDPAAGVLSSGTTAADAATSYPASSLAWAILAEERLSAGDTLTGYAFARVGYHRGLDALRRSGWKGFGPVPWSHEPNQGFLRCLAALALGADQIGEAAEAARCRQFRLDADPSVPRP
jgi:Protein of unknown function (DUF3151)